MNGHLEIRSLTEAQFIQYEDEWLDCLIHSDADPIFSSWAWCFSWWNTWSKLYSLKPMILAVFSNKELVGIAPLYSKKVDRKFGPGEVQLQFIGSSWRFAPSVRSEYTNFIIKRGFENPVKGALSLYLKHQSWADLIICDHQPHLKDFLSTLGVMQTIRSREQGVSLSTTGTFDNWLSSLGKKTRLKVYKRRGYLENRLVVEEVPVDDIPARECFFDQLSSFRQNRWQEQPSESELNFHKHLAKSAGNHLRPVYSILKIDGKIVSVVYDIIAQGRRYNLQSACVNNFDNKVSLGFLHLGFTIQSAFEAENIHTYDFLAGPGKHSFYKEHFIGSVGKKYKLLTSQVSKTHTHKAYLMTHMLARYLFSRA